MRINKNISLSRSFFIITTTLTFSALFAIILVSTLVVNKIYNEKTSKIRSDYIKDQEKLIKYQVERTVTGVYRWFNNNDHDDLLAQKEILGHISFIRFPNRGNEPGILFVRSYKGIVLASVSTPGLIGKDVSDMTDPDGINTHELFMNIVSESKGGFADYSWFNPASGKIEKKRSYILGIPELEWYIGGGFWLDDINSVIDDEIREFKRIFNNNIWYFVLYLIILLLLILYVTYRYKRRVKNNFIRFNDFFRKSTKKYTTIDVDNLSYSEFVELADSANLMISEREKIEMKLISAMEKAKESDNLKSAFLANISHEIRTPMNGILGFAGLLKDSELSSDESSKYLEIIEESGNRMLNIINDLIDISKLETGEMSLSLSGVDINKVLKTLYHFFEPEAEAKGIKLEYITGLESNNCIIECDNDKIYAILTNLIKNAIKFTSEGKITFGYKLTGKYLDFFVRDTGVGIPKNKQDLIFERFIQGDHSLSKTYEGAGLGLAITKAYVEMLKGEIRIESEPGKETTFYFTIPYKPPAKKRNENNESSTEMKESFKNNRLKILIVEDDPSSDIYLTVVVEKIQREVLHAKTGTEAIELIEKNPDTDIILMDIKIPEIDGFETTKRIRELNKDIVIIAQTAFATDHDREMALKSGCNDYIAKPFDKTELLNIINKHL